MKITLFLSALFTCTLAHDEEAVAPQLRINTKTGIVKSSIGHQFTDKTMATATKDDKCTHGDEVCNTDDECCSKYCRDGLCHGDKCKGDDRGCGHGHNEGSKECCSGLSCVNNTCIDDNNRQASKQKKMTSRERISKYVQERQMFWITDSANEQGVMLREDPDAADQTNFFESSSKGRYVHVKWFCTPRHAPDSNGDGMYDNLVAHSVSFMSADYNEETKTATARKWYVQGYTASWFEEGGYYNEVQVDFDGSTVFHFNGPTSILAYESSAAGSFGGLVVSGEGEWIFDIDHPILQAFAKEVGSELTPEACHDKYAEVWTANNKVPPA